MYWFEFLIGTPWENIPKPPQTLNCGELVRFVYKYRLGIVLPPILADGNNLRECVANMSVPEAYGFVSFEGDPRPFDIVYLRRSVRRDHVAIAVHTNQGLRFLHCIQECGVVLESEFEMKASTFSNFMEWRRHIDVSEEMAQCLA